MTLVRRYNATTDLWESIDLTPFGGVGPTGPSGPTGASGPTGETGLHVGESPPPTTDVLWLDTSVV